MMHDMHFGNWIALAIAVLLMLAVLISIIRARRERLAALQQHRPTPNGDPKHDEATLIRIGKVAADSSHWTGAS